MSSGGGGLLNPGARPSDLEGGDPWDAASPYARQQAAGQTQAFAVHASDTPRERPSRKRRLLVFGGLAALVIAAMVVALVLGGPSSSSSTTSASSSSMDDSGGEAAGQSSSGGGDSGSSSGGESGGGGSSGSDAGSYEVRFLAVGDWGRQGKLNQSEVAALMGAVAASSPVDFVVSTGDNMYDSGLTSADDPRFDETFTDIYTAPSLQVPWHAVLGNHDYCDNAEGCDTEEGCAVSPLHQLNISLNNRDPRWHCERRFTHAVAGGKVELFFVDTSPFIDRYYEEGDPTDSIKGLADTSWRFCAGGLMQQSWRAQLLELEHALAASAADWKLVVGHHPTYSNGEHGPNLDVIARLEPLLWQYGVAAYLCGHDHNLESLRVPAPDGSAATYDVIVTGGGSKTDREQGGDGSFSQWYHKYSGFAAATVTPERLTLAFYTLEGGEAAAFETTIERRVEPPS